MSDPDKIKELEDVLSRLRGMRNSGGATREQLAEVVDQLTGICVGLGLVAVKEDAPAAEEAPPSSEPAPPASEEGGSV